MKNQREKAEPRSYTFNEAGAMEVAQQIMDSYNSGVIDAQYVESTNEE